MQRNMVPKVHLLFLARNFKRGCGILDNREFWLLKSLGVGAVFRPENKASVVVSLSPMKFDETPAFCFIFFGGKKKNSPIISFGVTLCLRSSRNLIHESKNSLQKMLESTSAGANHLFILSWKEKETV